MVTHPTHQPVRTLRMSRLGPPSNNPSANASRKGGETGRSATSNHGTPTGELMVSTLETIRPPRQAKHTHGPCSKNRAETHEPLQSAHESRFGLLGRSYRTSMKCIMNVRCIPLLTFQLSFQKAKQPLSISSAQRAITSTAAGESARKAIKVKSWCDSPDWSVNATRRSFRKLSHLVHEAKQ